MRITSFVRFNFVSTIRVSSLVVCITGGLGTTSPSIAQEPTQTISTALLDSERLGGKSIFGEQERLPSVTSGRLELPTLTALTIGTADIGNGSTPKEFRNEAETPQNDLPESGHDRSHQWPGS